jgi:hypothetical protein
LGSRGKRAEFAVGHFLQEYGGSRDSGSDAKPDRKQPKVISPSDPSGSSCFFSTPGLHLAAPEPLRPIVRTRAAFWLAMAYLVFAFIVTMAVRAPDLGALLPHWMLQPFDPNDKTNLASYRVLHLVALVVVVTRFLPAVPPLLRWRALAPLIKCGQSLLQVFCVGIMLSFCAHVAIEVGPNSLSVQFLVGPTGILLMTALAYWIKQRVRLLPSSTRIRELA